MAGTHDSKVTTYSVKNGKDAITPAVLVAILNKAMRDKKLDPDTPIVVYSDTEGNGAGKLVMVEVADSECAFIPSDPE